MKLRFYILFGIVAGLGGKSAVAQFPIFPAADRVLGAVDFSTIGGRSQSDASKLNGPVGLAIDPASGKLFVVSTHYHRILRFSNAASLINGDGAEVVFGQVDFAGRSPGTTAAKLHYPKGIHVDYLGRLWVADSFNGRVLMFQDASSAESGAAADLVLGQADFVTKSGEISASRMASPEGVFVDSGDNLWVADRGNYRVLKFAAVSGLANGAPAATVLGQPNFVSIPFPPSVGPAKMSEPKALTVDGGGRLWVADSGNNRVLRFDNAASLASGAPATAVLGQAILTSRSSGATSQKMNQPSAVIADPSGSLYVLDEFNARVLIFKSAASKANGAAADGLIGQADFTSTEYDISQRNLAVPSIGMAMEGESRLWVSDTGNARVLRFPLRSTEVLLDATMSALLGNDLNNNNQGDAGELINYSITISNPDDANDADCEGAFFTLTPPMPLQVGSVVSSQGTVVSGNFDGDTSIGVDLGVIRNTESVTITFSLALGFEVLSPLLVQGEVTSESGGILFTDDPALLGIDNPTEFEVNYTYRPASFTVITPRRSRSANVRLSGTAAAAWTVEASLAANGRLLKFPVAGISWTGSLPGLKNGSNLITLRALGKDGNYTPSQTVIVRRLKPRKFRALPSR